MKRLRESILAWMLLGSIAYLGAAGIAMTVIMIESCAKAPPQLSPTAQREFYATRVIKVLDIVRDFAIDGEAAGLVSTTDTRHIVLWHKSAVQVASTVGANWQTVVATTLDSTVANLKPETKTKLAPYVALVKAVLSEVP